MSALFARSVMDTMFLSPDVFGSCLCVVQTCSAASEMLTGCSASRGAPVRNVQGPNHRVDGFSAFSRHFGACRSSYHEIQFPIPHAIGSVSLPQQSTWQCHTDLKYTSCPMSARSLPVFVDGDLWPVHGANDIRLQPNHFLCSCDAKLECASLRVIC